MEKDFDFSGWATKNDLLCADGRVIKKNAFIGNDGQKVPIVWMHQHNDPTNILGHAILENRDEGVYAYGKFNDTPKGKYTKSLVEHGDLDCMSIWANQLKQNGNNVIHGNIREVSIVISGANPGAYIDTVICHSGDSDEEEGVICMNEKDSLTMLAHADEDTKSKTETSDDEETVGDVFNTLTEKQKNVVYAIIGEALNSADGSDEDEEDDNSEGGNDDMKHNVFDQQETQENQNVLSHDAMQTILADGKRFGSLKESFLQHASTYGIEQIDWLFPEARTLNNPPEFIKRDTTWVQKVMSGVHHTPFSRIKSVFADITEDDARAKGYMKGKLKKEEVFSLLKRTTTPTTVYKKQKLDRDDQIDITDFDVVSWLKAEMRMMLDEELARAYLIGDGRLASSDDKINESNIRPIMKDEELYTIQSLVSVSNTATDDDIGKAFIRAAIKARKDYKGSGQPTLFTTEDMLINMLLLEDTIGHPLYVDEAALARKLRVREIVTVPVMEGVNGKDNKPLLGIIVNLADYNVGADRGGAINMFDDFDIDYNQQKYLIETRCSGALTKPYSAIALQLDKAGV